MPIKFSMPDSSPSGKRKISNAKGLQPDTPLTSKSYVTSGSAYLPITRTSQFSGYGANVAISQPMFFSPMFTPQSWQIASRRKEIYQWLFINPCDVMTEDYTYSGLTDISFDYKKVVQDTLTGGVLFEGIDYPPIMDSEGNFRKPPRYSERECINKRIFKFYAIGYWRTVSISEEHYIFVLDGSEGLIKRTMSCNVSSNDYLLTPVPHVGNKSVDKDMAWLIGLLATDGCLSKSASGSYAVRIPEHLQKVVDAIWGQQCGNNNVWRVDSGHVWETIKDFIVLNNKHSSKKFTNFIAQLDRESRLHLIAGYLDGVGSFDETGDIVVNISSCDLSDQLYALLLSTDIVCSLNKVPLHGGNYACATNSEWFYRICIHNSEVHKIAPYIKGDKTPFNQPANLKRGLRFFYENSGIKYLCSPIAKIEQFYYNGKGFDIEMTNERHALVAGGYICSNSRFYYENEPKVAAGVDFYSQFPLSGFVLECKDKKVLSYFEQMVEELRLANWLRLISHEYFLLGDVFPFLSIECPHCSGTGIKPNGKPCNHPDGKFKSITVLNPDFIEVTDSPFPDQRQIYLIPDEQLRKTVLSKEPKNIYDRIPDQLKKLIASGQNILLSPRSVSHIKHSECPYGKYGVSMLRRLFHPLAYKTKLMTANWIVAERLILPVRVIKIGDKDRPAGPDDIADMQQQISALANDPNLTIVTHHAFEYDYIGATGKIHNITSELEYIGKELLDGLMLNQALLNGEMSGYASAQVGIETLIKRLETWRATLSDWIYEHLFKPTAMMQGFIDEEATKELGKTKYLYPTIKFNDMQLRDKTNRLQMFMQLHDKGLISTEKLLEEFDIDYDQEMIRIRRQQVMSSPGGPSVGGTGGIAGGAGGGMPVMGGMDMMGGPPPGGDIGGMPGGDMGGGAGGASPPMGAAASSQKVYKKGKAPKAKDHEIKMVAPSFVKLTRLEQKTLGIIQELQLPFKLYGQFQKKLPGEPQPFVMDFAMPEIMVNIECLHPDQLVSTVNGSLPACTIQEGDKLIGQNGDEVVVERKIINLCTHNLLSIKVLGHLPIHVTKNHPMLVAKPKKVSRLSVEPNTTRYRTYVEPGDISFINADEIKVGDFLMMPKFKTDTIVEQIDLSDCNKIAPKGSKILPDSIEATEELGWLLGVYLAEGCSDTNGSNVVFSFNINEIEYVEKVQLLLKNIFNLDSKLYHNLTDHCARVSVSSHILASFLHNSFGQHTHLKKLPKWIYQMPDIFIVGFVRGFLGSDGCENLNIIQRYISSSVALLMDLQRLLTRLNIFANLCQSRSQGTVNGLWELTIYSNVQEKQFYEDNNYFYMPVKTIIEIPYTGDVINFTTSGVKESNHTYCVGNLISHNCDGAIWHEQEGAKERDAERDRKLASYGWRVLRFTEQAINQNADQVKQLIYENVKEAAEEHFHRRKTASSVEKITKHASEIDHNTDLDDKS